MVILLITGPICSGKETFTEILKEQYGYIVHKIQSSSLEKVWDFEKETFFPEVQKEIMKESTDTLKEALVDWKNSHVIYPLIYSEPVNIFLLKRSYIKIVSINAPVLKRYKFFLEKYKIKL